MQQAGDQPGDEFADAAPHTLHPLPNSTPGPLVSESQAWGQPHLGDQWASQGGSLPVGLDSQQGDAMFGMHDYDEYEHEMVDGRRTTKKKSKGGRIASEITREELSNCFNMASKDAAKKLGVSLTGRIASEITREELSNCFNMASEDAAKKLGVGLTVLKRICRKFGVPRWPYRKLKSLDRLITNVESGQAPGETYRHLMKSAEEIRQRQQAMCLGQVQDLDEQTKKLQQAYSKFNHKLRKATRDDDPNGLEDPTSSGHTAPKLGSDPQQWDRCYPDGYIHLEASTSMGGSFNDGSQDVSVGQMEQNQAPPESGQQDNQLESQLLQPTFPPHIPPQGDLGDPDSLAHTNRLANGHVGGKLRAYQQQQEIMEADLHSGWY
eukprot:gene4479-14638_t